MLSRARSIGEVDPIVDLGVHRGSGCALPPYRPSTVDGVLDRALADGGLVLLEGESVSGKSRAAYEAARRFAQSIVVPADGAELRALEPARARHVVWLDRIERFCTDDALESLLAKGNSVLLGTIRPAEREFLAQSPEYERLFRDATTVRLARNDFAASLAATPAAEEKWRDAANELGAALISAAAGFRRARYPEPVPFAWLKAIAPRYLEPKEPGDESESAYRAALDWATEPVRGAAVCLERIGEDRFRAPDHIAEKAPEDVPADLWHLLAEELPVDDPHYLTCMSLAGRAGHPMIAWQLRQALRGDDRPEGARLLEIARSCVDYRMCVACEFAGHDIDLALLLTEVGTTLADRREDRFHDALLTADQLGVVGKVAQPASAAGIAAGSLAPELVLATAQALLEAERVEAAKEWFAVARER